MLKLKMLILAVLFPVAAFAHGYSRGGLTIGHPWSRATPAGASQGVAYAKITNTGPVADRLIGATFAGASRVEFHETVTEEGVSKMRPVTSGIVLEPGKVVEFKPSGLHIMLRDLSQPIVVGPRIAGTLIFEKAGPIDVEFKIEPVGAAGSADEHQHQH